MNIGGHDIGVCGWSLKQASTADLVATLKRLGLGHVQMALAPLMDRSVEQRTDSLNLLRDNGIEIVSGMVNFPDENYASIASIRQTGGFVSPTLWPARSERALALATLAADIGVTTVSAHAGFIPPSGDPAYREVVDHLGQLASGYAKHGVDLLLETGQEKATELLQFLNDLNAPNVGVNFDAANMILYGAGDPTEAVAILGRHIRHVHIKDAVVSAQPGIEWGHEEPFGDGDLDVHSLLRALHDVGYDGPLIIEREAGPERVSDVQAAIDVLAAHYGE
ncbi:MAG TPA: sugar phosphate isomerase/epimerase family protein [Tepidisphaeraceae bacterium]|jgi:sugar phosphate isomerase/epimerase